MYIYSTSTPKTQIRNTDCDDTHYVKLSNSVAIGKSKKWVVFRALKIDNRLGIRPM